MDNIYLLKTFAFIRFVCLGEKGVKGEKGNCFNVKKKTVKKTTTVNSFNYVGFSPHPPPSVVMSRMWAELMGGNFFGFFVLH